MLKKAVELAKKRQKNTFSLEVKKTNKAAISFYRKLGFIQTKTLENFYDDGQAALVFQLKIE